ncbi:hypothetical protein JDV02_002555 [Purpureocillium takamizusanense]|uniref:Uncharacterized protein n=1 Tax=Purpureocillium takamizusanense TaxID=2060973 RepID=A0A9Q8V8S2_9HYPO|nr:uncharacterized protein JDV02_002555 [Purpureocillium takamizusanense]UNI16082.1 hypothetical protein JDV02_002555 [Purpureocillium takamizusanense]
MPRNAALELFTPTASIPAGHGVRQRPEPPRLRRCEARCFSAVEKADAEEMVFTFRVPDLTIPELAATDRISEYERTRLAEERTRDWLRDVATRLAGLPLGPELGVAAAAVMEWEAGRREREARRDGEDKLGGGNMRRGRTRSKGREGEEQWWEDVGAVLRECSEFFDPSLFSLPQRE